jgi:Cu(I)/Ag(I) efflux system membrane fusion protein
MKNLLLISAIFLMISGIAISCNNEEKKTENTEQATTATNGKYSCSCHPEVTSDTPGTCPKCGMDLEDTSSTDSTATE